MSLCFVALVTFLAVMLASSAVFLYFNSQRSVADLAASGRGHCFYRRIRSSSGRNGRSALRRSFMPCWNGSAG